MVNLGLVCRVSYLLTIKKWQKLLAVVVTFLNYVCCTMEVKGRGYTEQINNHIGTRLFSLVHLNYKETSKWRAFSNRDFWWWHDCCNEETWVPGKQHKQANFQQHAQWPPTEEERDVSCLMWCWPPQYAELIHHNKHCVHLVMIRSLLFAHYPY